MQPLLSEKYKADVVKVGIPEKSGSLLIVLYCGGFEEKFKTTFFRL